MRNENNLLLSRGSEYAKESPRHSRSRRQNSAVSSERNGYLFNSVKNQIVRLSIFCTMCLGIILFSATVIGDNQDDYSSHTEETLEFHIQRPPSWIWRHIFEDKDIPADVEHTHPAETHTHKNYYGDEDENGDPTETFPEHTHAAYTHAAHNKAHYRPGASGHTPHNSDDLHSHDYIIDYEKTLSHVHPSDTSHMGGRAHSHPGWWHLHGDGEELHEDHEADGEHTHPPISVPGPIKTSGHALPYRNYIGYNGYTHTHPDPAFEAHKTEKPPHTDHTSYVAHSHNEVTHTHDDFSEHTHTEHSHSHADDVAELDNHKTERPSHTTHKSFVEHTHNGQPHSHGAYPSHTHNGYSHSHTDDIAELEAHKQVHQTHTPHKSFVEHTHNPQTHSHDDYPSHTHSGITHTHQAEINELEAHRQQRLPHVENAATGEHEHTAQPHQHDAYPEHTHVSYIHTHPIEPQPQTQPEPGQPDDADTIEQNTQTGQQFETTTPQNTNPNTDTQTPQTGQDNGQQPESETNSEPEPNYTIIPFDYEKEGVGKVVFSELMLAHLDKYPQWIELYNTTDQDIDINGWKIVGRYMDDSNAVNILESQVISKSFSVKGKETVLIVSFATQNSTDRISRGLADKAYALQSTSKNLWNYHGLVLELQDAEGNPIDRIGNLNEENEIVWEIPMVVRNKRISLIRRLKSIRSQEYNFTFGIKEFGWFHAEKVEHLIEKRNQYYYGTYTDIGAPGYRTEDREVLPVTLSSFSAQRNNNDQILLRWVTESELDNAGFNILRSQSKHGTFVKINPKLIQGVGTTSERSTYTWTDTTAKPNTVYYYWIEDVSYAGVHKTLATTRLRGLISAKGKIVMQWADFKSSR